jgi:hypothetical protein
VVSPVLVPLDPEDVPFSTFGIPVDRELRYRLYELMADRGRVPWVNDATPELLVEVGKAIFRDAKLTEASGRWAPGSLDPLRFVAGDVAAIRSIAAFTPVGGAAAILFLDKRPAAMPASGPDLEVAVEHLWPFLQAAALYEAQSYFLPVTSAIGILASQPPAPEMLADLRLPYPKVAVFFGADLAIPSELVVGEDQDGHRRWLMESGEASARFGLAQPADILVPIALHGGYLSGVVLFEGDGGGLADEVIWILASEDPPAQKGSELDRGRGFAMGLRSRSSLNPFVANLAAAVSWGDWHPPEATLELPPAPGSPAWNDAVRSGRFRRQEPRGGFAGIRVLDVQQMHARAKPARRPQDGEGHASPVTHLRRGHWKRVRVGPRADWSYSPRWIPPVVVNPTNTGGTPLRVYRLPLPPTAAEEQR